MLKDPFVKCKKRKRKKIFKGTKIEGFCPRTMVRYDDSPSGYKHIWACKMCLAFLLSEEAVKDHLKECNTSSHNKMVKKPVTRDEDIRYVCDVCNRVFSRKVTLKKHKEQHEVSSENEFDESDNDFVFTPEPPEPPKPIDIIIEEHIEVPSDIIIQSLENPPT